MMTWYTCCVQREALADEIPNDEKIDVANGKGTAVRALYNQIKLPLLIEYNANMVSYLQTFATCSVPLPKSNKKSTAFQLTPQCRNNQTPGMPCTHNRFVNVVLSITMHRNPCKPGPKDTKVYCAITLRSLKLKSKSHLCSFLKFAFLVDANWVSYEPECCAGI